MEAIMNAKKLLLLLAAAAPFAIVGSTPASSDLFSSRHKGGYVIPCSLDGVNPVYHPDIFGNPAAAREYGFVRAPNGAWQVMANCRRGVTVPY
jgi:hypothetical protein